MTYDALQKYLFANPTGDDLTLRFMWLHLIPTPIYIPPPVNPLTRVSRLQGLLNKHNLLDTFCVKLAQKLSVCVSV